ncbi:MAG: HEAT repeat domain-containing protein [Gemmataceae bacterium]
MKRLLGLVAILICAAAASGADVNDLIKQLQSGDNEARRAAAVALGDGGADSKTAVPTLIKALKDRDTFVRRFSARALGSIGPDAASAVRDLTQALNDRKPEVRDEAARALGKLGSSGVASLIAIVRDDGKDAAMRRQAIDSLGSLGSAARSAVPVLTELVKEPGGKAKKKKMAPNDVRVNAANALGTLAAANDKEVIDALEALTGKKVKAPRELKQAAKSALQQIRRKKK